MSFLVPECLPHVKQKCDELYGLPYVCLAEDPKSVSRYVGQLRNGHKVTADQIEQIFNAGLMLEHIEGRGAATRQVGDPGMGANKLHAELLALSERLFGSSIEDALPIYLRMSRTEYARWDDRPRVKWAQEQVN